MTSDEYNDDHGRIAPLPDGPVPEPTMPGTLVALDRNDQPILTPAAARQFLGLDLQHPVGAGEPNDRADVGLVLDFLHGPDYLLTNDAYVAERPSIVATGHPLRDADMPATIAAIGSLRRKIAAGLPLLGIGQRPVVAVPAGPGSAPLPPGLTEADIGAATRWAGTQRLARHAIEELQRALEVVVTGTYDRQTAMAVYLRQRAWQPHGRIAERGKAGSAVFDRLGLILTHATNQATVGPAVLHVLDRLGLNPTLQDVISRYPGGVTVAVMANLRTMATNSNDRELRNRIEQFTTAYRPVGVRNGALAVGAYLPIDELGQVIEGIQQIHEALLAGWRAREGGNPVGQPPLWTMVKTLAIFSHGEYFGMGLNRLNAFDRGGVHTDRGPLHPSNVRALVRGLSGAVASDLRLALFACNVAHDETRFPARAPRAGGHVEHEDRWEERTQGLRTGADSLAGVLAGELGPTASVSGHTTAGHTTENYAARVFGAASGGGGGGLHLFDLMYPEPFIQSELARLYPRHTETQRAGLHSALRDRMWAHFKESIKGEHDHPTRGRYPRPIGEEAFVDPDSARQLLQDDWTRWAPPALSGQLKPDPAPSP